MTATPRCVAYQAARDSGSRERKKSPPMPRTFSMAPPRGRRDISQRTQRCHRGRGEEGNRGDEKCAENRRRKAVPTNAKKRGHGVSRPYTLQTSITGRGGSGIGARRGDARRSRRDRGGRGTDGIRGGCDAK